MVVRGSFGIAFTIWMKAVVSDRVDEASLFQSEATSEVPGLPRGVGGFGRGFGRSPMGGRQGQEGRPRAQTADLQDEGDRKVANLKTRLVKQRWDTRKAQLEKRFTRLEQLFEEREKDLNPKKKEQLLDESKKLLNDIKEETAALQSDMEKDVLPRVGSGTSGVWLFGSSAVSKRMHNKEKQEKAKEKAFKIDGKWRHGGPVIGKTATISGSWITWGNGEKSPIEILKDECKMNSQGKRYTGRLVDGDLHWSDGEVWTRVPEAS